MTPTTKHFRKRDAILACLRQTKTHPGAEWVYEQLKPQVPDLSRGTVYRNLSLFKEQGLIQSLGTVGGVERFDGCTDPHVHFICTRCGAVLDMENVELPSLTLPDVGRVESCSLSFTGICKDCLTAEC